MGDGNAKGFSVNAKTIILILLFLNVGLTIKMFKKYQNTKDAGYVREQTFKDQMEKRVQRAFGSAEELNRIVEDATRQKEEAEKIAEVLKEQDAKTKQLNKELEHAKKQLEVEKDQLQRNIKELEKNLEAAKKEITTPKNQQKR
jgi:septal ring factor EnvC (AmiA/AmiB activator)